ncbi:MAG: glycosyltransferase [Candidatus Bathyarchaeia archaeon]
MTSFLIIVSMLTVSYRPIPDRGYRPGVSVIVPAKNEEKGIADTVNALLQSDYPEDKLEIIVVNDGSTDKTADAVRAINSPRIKLLDFEKNRGKRAAFASGFYESKNEIVICVDSDTLLDTQAIKLVVQPFEDKEVVSVCGHGKASNINKNLLTKLQHFWYQDMFRLLKGMESQLGAVSCCSGILAGYRRESIEPLMNSWLNEKFLGRPIYIGDDRQLTNLVLWKGLGEVKDGTRNAKVIYQSNAIAYTLVPETYKHFFKQQLMWSRSWIHGSILASRFIWKKKMPVPLLFFVYQFLTVICPFAIVSSLIITPLTGNILSAVWFLLGTLYIGLLQGMNLWSFGYDFRALLYRTLFVFVSFFMSITVLLYAWITPWKGGWVTRCDKKK